MVHNRESVMSAEHRDLYNSGLNGNSSFNCIFTYCNCNFVDKVEDIPPQTQVNICRYIFISGPDYKLIILFLYLCFTRL
jgi:hypothetical protein